MAGRGSIWLCVWLGALVAGGFGCGTRSSSRQSEAPVVVDKQPVSFANRAFDPSSPPADMPPLGTGEQAECDSNFLSNASVGGETQKTDATHAFVTITQIKMTLQLNITIWAPVNVSSHVMEHEDGHRQISEHYYETADKVAERIAAKYIGEKIEITGSDLSAESSKYLEQTATEITNEYEKELNPEATQLLYDSITDHGRNEVVVKDAVVSAIKNVVAESRPPATPGN